MRIIDKKKADKPIIEVLQHLNSHPPHAVPAPPVNANLQYWVPRPDLRDHNTVVNESYFIQFHSYVNRISPHLLKYPHSGSPLFSDAEADAALEAFEAGNDAVEEISESDAHLDEAKPASRQRSAMSQALRGLITRLRPFGLSKSEVLMILNLGVGLHHPAPEATTNGEAMDVEGGEEEDEGPLANEESGTLALFEAIVEDRDERFSDEEVKHILTYIRYFLDKDYLKSSVSK
ncbi:hypothetical protein N7495_008604 [Penicillium taxi]|uniref:uncharacterized protein n=1 Tax=Penicillium taxi TaxID=168475 RepID=UPI0025458CA6|nr:uncharacterized protein N7495_008604 [Penicillium taxi]KAJ5888563.1 hypothetical protein N7495_008604 [Penicillium taxi]